MRRPRIGVQRYLEQGGSVLLLTLMVCLGLAATALALATMTDLSRLLIAEDEHARQVRTLVDGGLPSVVRAATEQPVARPLEVPGLAYARIDESEGAAPFSLGVVAAMAVDGGFIEVRARLERATDGIDLPDRVLVAARASLAGGRLLGDAVQGSDSEAARVCLTSPSTLAAGFSSAEVELGRAWALDEGQWRALEEAAGLASSRVVFAQLETAGRPSLNDSLGRAPEYPVVLVGGRDVPLDLSGFGHLYGIVLAGDLGVRLEGTTLHGGAFTSGEVRFGECGQVVDLPSVRCWASTASLPVSRLVPGTRWEEVVVTGS